MGTTTQVVVGVTLSFGFFSAHIKYMPYRHIEDNMLRATTELHLFIVMQMVLTLKGDLSGEMWDVKSYDLIATVLFVIFVPVALVVCIVYKWYKVVQDDKIAIEDPQYVDVIKAAFARHQQGSDKLEDREILSKYIDSLEAEVDTGYHVFISYRVASEKALALQLHTALTAKKLNETGQQLRVFLDQVSLEDGEQWDVSFMRGLAKSWVVVPIISDHCVASMRGIEEKDVADNVLLEWLGALELYSRGVCKAILPVISPAPGSSEFTWSLVQQLSQTVHTPTVDAAERHLRDHVTSAGLEERELLNGAIQMVNDSDSNAVSADKVRAKLSDMKLGQIATASADYGMDEERVQAIIDESDDPVSSVVDHIVEETSAGANVRGILEALLRFQGVLFDQRNDPESVRTQLTGLNMGEILDQCGDFGVDRATVQAAMNSSDDPISTAIDLLAEHAPAAPQKTIDECAERVLATVSSALNVFPIFLASLFHHVFTESRRILAGFWLTRERPPTTCH